MMGLESGKLADVLVSQSWQIAVVFGVVAVICWLSRRSSAHWRYLLWLIVVVKCLTPPIVRVPVGVLPSEGAAPAASHASGERGGPVAAHAADFRSELLPGVAGVEPLAQAGAQGVAARLSGGAVPHSGERQVGRSPSVWGWAGVAWAAGAGALLLYAVLKAWRIHRRLELSRQLADGAVQGEAEALCRRMGIRVPPAVYLVDGFSQPFVWGLLRGDVYLPSAMAGDAGGRGKILAHELAHVARWDAAVNALQVLVQGLFFFHPLVWWANRQIRRERESCCDEAAIAVLAAPPQDYSRAIVDSLIHGRGQATPALSVAGPAKNIEARIRAIMRPDRIFRARPTPTVVLAVSVLAVVALMVGLVPTHRARAEAQSGAADIPTAKLPDDVTVSLLAVSRLDEQPRRWWRPDGTPLAEPPYPGTERTDAKHQFELVFGLSDDVDGSENIGAGGTCTSVLGKPKGGQGKHLNELRVVHTGFGDTAPDTTTARYALATGPWSRLATWQPHRADGSPNTSSTVNTILFKPPVEEDGVTVLPFVHLPISDATRMVAITRDGRMVTPFSTYVTGLVVSDTVCKFRVRLADIDLFEFSTRPYDTAEFRNVSLRPGQQTSVEVVTTHSKGELPGVERRHTDRDAPGLAEMMGLVENFLMHNFKDVTWRKSLEWGEVERNEDGARSIRYMYEARIWDRETMVMNQVFTFARDGTFVRYENVEGFPKPKEAKVADVSTQQGMIELVEDFFRNNFRDITSRETIEWGQVTRGEKGNSSIRYKYRATIWGKDKKVLDQIFTFDPSGTFVSVRDAQESSKRLDLSTPAATAKALTQAVARQDVAGALACFAADSHDREDMRQILEGPQDHPMRQIFDAIAPTIPIRITKQDVSDGRCEIAWQVILKRAVTIKGTTLPKGKAFDLDGTLKKAGESWLFVGL